MDLYPIMKKRIDEYDFMGLLSGGCPADEFDAESRMVAARVRTDSSVEEIAGVLAEVFAEQFAQAQTPEAFLAIAGKIKEDMR